MAEEFHLHLFKLTRTENEVTRCNFVAEAFSNLSDTEREFDSRTIHHILEVNKHTLRGFGAQERSVSLTTQRTEGRLEHQVELTRVGQFATATWAAWFKVVSWFQASRSQSRCVLNQIHVLDFAVFRGFFKLATFRL